jgi:hypothetical protein
MFEWAKLLFSKPSPGTPLTIYTEWNGYFYFFGGSSRAASPHPDRHPLVGHSYRVHHIRTVIFWSDILIESTGGTDPVTAAGALERWCGP